MMYLITIILILFFNNLLHPQKSNYDNDTGIYYTKARLKYCLIIGGWFFLLLILRHDYVGTDTQNYRLFFDTISRNGLDLNLNDADLSTEYGFYYLNQVLINCGLPFRALLIISAFIYIGTISCLIYKFSEKPWLSYFIFLTFGFFIFNTTMRQCFAISFCIIAFFFAINKKLLPCLLFILLACLFHATAIIFFPIYFITKLNYNRRSLLIVLIAGALIALFSSQLFQYANEITEKSYDEKSASGYGSLIFTLIVIILGFIHRRQLPDSNKYWFFLLLVGICLFPIASLNPALFRINLYFQIFIIVYIANLLSGKISITPAFYSLVIIFGIYKFVIGTRLAGIRVYPYVFYWENYYEKNPDARLFYLE